MNRQLYPAATVVMLGLGVLLRQPALVSLGILGGLTLLIAWGWGRAALAGLTYERRFAEDHVFWGETVRVSVTLTNFKLLPLFWLETEERFPRQLPFLGEPPGQAVSAHDFRVAHTTALRWFERIHWHYDLSGVARGLYLFGPVMLRSGDPFGLVVREGRQPAAARLYIYPQMLDLPALGLPPRHPFGDIRASQQLLEDPLRAAGVREYRPEDPFKHVHWKATARTQQLQVRLYDQTTTHTLMLFLNIESWEYIYEGVDTERSEWGIVVAASLARYAAAQHWSVGLHSNAPAADNGEAVRLPPSHDPAQLVRLLEALARMFVLPGPGFIDLLRIETQHLPAGSTVVTICPVLTPAIRGALLRLRERGLRAVVCVLSDAPPEPLPGLLVHHLPPPKNAPYLRNSVSDLLTGPPPLPPRADAVGSPRQVLEEASVP